MLISKNNMNTCTYLIHTLSLIYAMKLLVIFGIKIYRKLPSYLTFASARPCHCSLAGQRRAVACSVAELAHPCVHAFAGSAAAARSPARRALACSVVVLARRCAHSPSSLVAAHASSVAVLAHRCALAGRRRARSPLHTLACRHPLARIGSLVAAAPACTCTGLLAARCSNLLVAALACLHRGERE